MRVLGILGGVALLFGCQKGANVESVATNNPRGEERIQEQQTRQTTQEPSRFEALNTREKIVSFLESEPDALDKPGVLVAILSVPDALEDQRILRHARDLYIKRREEAVFYGASVTLLGAARDQHSAPMFLADAERMQPIDFSQVTPHQLAALLPESNKYNLMRTVVDINEPRTMERLSRLLSVADSNTQRLISYAFRSSEHIEHARICIQGIGVSSSEDVKNDLQNAANNIVYHALEKDISTRNTAVNLATTLKELGLAKEYLVDRLSTLTHVPK